MRADLGKYLARHLQMRAYLNVASKPGGLPFPCLADEVGHLHGFSVSQCERG